jgi:hypothetical protein
MQKVHAVGPADVVALGARGVYSITISAQEHWTNIETLLKKYSDRSISLADACLIRCAEIHEEARILTFDSDFSSYKWARNRKFEILLKQTGRSFASAAYGSAARRNARTSSRTARPT